MSELYNLPNDWEWVFIDDKNSNKIKASGINKFIGEKNYLSTKSIQNNKICSVEEIITYDNRPSRANLQPLLGDVFFAKMQATEKVLSVNLDISNSYIISTGFIGIEILNNKFESKYLKYYFKTNYFNSKKDELCGGGTQKAINNQNAKLISIPFPPLEEQKRIVAKLDILFEKIDKAIALHQKNCEEVDIFMSSILNDVFGELEEKYEKKQLNEIIKIIGGGTPSKANKEYWENGTIKWATVRDMNVEKIIKTELSITEIGLKKVHLI